ncbi:YecA family protein [Bacillus sp. Hm123]|uniref:YecA family protein n=1 Tax=Bacillus sp. Hm123 TaxID=3450745 RepID=UPI003F42F140
MIPYVFEPYKPCPCGSTAKYKFCCYKKSKENPKNTTQYNSKRLYFESHKLFRETDFQTCFGFDENCEHGFIGAHSLQNNGVLNLIAHENHVYSLDMNFDEKSLLPKLEFKKTGKNQASTFNGFCKHHDEAYFNIIEDQPYINTPEQNYWYALRAHCFEAHRKYRLQKSFSNLFKQSPHATRDIQISTNFRGNELTIRDMETDYSRFKEIYEKGEYERLENFVKVLPFKVGFTATTAVAVNVDIQGNPTVDIYDYDEKLFVPSIYLSVIPKASETLIIVSRFREDECYNNFITSLDSCTDDKLLFSYLTHCLAEYSENIYFSPELIDNQLTDVDKQLILKAFLGVASPTFETRLASMKSMFQLDLFKYHL